MIDHGVHSFEGNPKNEKSKRVNQGHFEPAEDRQTHLVHAEGVHPYRLN